MRVFISERAIDEIDHRWGVTVSILGYIKENQQAMNEIELAFHTEEFISTQDCFLQSIRSAKPFWMTNKMWDNYLYRKIGLVQRWSSKYVLK